MPPSRVRGFLVARLNCFPLQFFHGEYRYYYEKSLRDAFNKGSYNLLKNITGGRPKPPPNKLIEFELKYSLRIHNLKITNYGHLNRSHSPQETPGIALPFHASQEKQAQRLFQHSHQKLAHAHHPHQKKWREPIIQKVQAFGLVQKKPSFLQQAH